MILTLLKSFCYQFIKKNKIIRASYLVLFTLISQQLFSQVDVNRPNDFSTDSLRAYSYFQLFQDFIYDNNLDSALYFVKQSNDLAYELRDSLLIVRTGYGLAFSYSQMGLYNEAQKQLVITKKFALDHIDNPEYYERLKLIYNLLGVVYYKDGIFEQALQEHFQNIKYRQEEIEKTGDYNEADLGVAYTNIGLVYYKLGDLIKAIDYQHKAISDLQKRENVFIADNYVNLGLAYSQMGTSQSRYPEHPRDFYYDSSKYYFRQAIARCEYFEYCREKTLFEVYNGLGIIHEKLGVLDSSSYYLNLASSADPNLDNQVTVLHNQANIKIKEGNYDEAKRFLTLASKMIDSTDHQEGRVDNYYLNAQISKEQLDYKNAYFQYKQYDSLKELLFNESIRSKAKSLEIEFAQTENLATIERKEKDLKERTTFLSYAVITIALFLIFGIILFRSNVLRKRVNKQLSNATKIIENKNQLLENLNNELEERVKDRTFELNTANKALQQSNEELDNFIYKTSHDIRGPLATLQGICNVALMDVQDARAIDYLQKLGKTASRLNEILSKLLVINQINNSQIGKQNIDFNLIVDHVVQDNRKTNAADIAVVKEIAPDLLFKSDHDLIKIIIANTVNNAFKYYNPSDRIESFVKISVDTDTKYLKISIVDNGIGIDDKQGDKIFEIFSKASDSSDSAGLGLYLVKLSVEKLNGQVKLIKTREKFTEFRVKLPLNVV